MGTQFHLNGVIPKGPVQFHRICLCSEEFFSQYRTRSLPTSGVACSAGRRAAGGPSPIFTARNGDISHTWFALCCDVLRFRTRREFELRSSPTARMVGVRPGHMGNRPYLRHGRQPRAERVVERFQGLLLQGRCSLTPIGCDPLRSSVTHSRHAHFCSARPAAVNPARSAPFGLRGLTATAEPSKGPPFQECPTARLDQGAWVLAETSVTGFGPNGLSRGCRVFCSRSK